MVTTLKQTFWSVMGLTASVIAILLWKRRFPTFDALTYEDAITYFVENKPTSVSKGIIVRKVETGGTYLISQLFLDKYDEIIRKPNGSSYGRTVRVRSMDAELLEAFRDKDVIVCT
jgi:hypothetical protein